MGILLMLLMMILKVLAPIGFVWAIVELLIIGTFRYGYKKGWIMFDGYCKNVAIGGDQQGNGVMGVMFNRLFIKFHGYRYGNIDETISSATGKNQEMGSLTRLGRWFSFRVLDKIEKDHSVNSIDNTETDEGY